MPEQTRVKEAGVGRKHGQDIEYIYIYRYDNRVDEICIAAAASSDLFIHDMQWLWAGDPIMNRWVLVVRIDQQGLAQACNQL